MENTKPNANCSFNGTTANHNIDENSSDKSQKNALKKKQSSTFLKKIQKN